MFTRPKLFLTFLILFLVPLLLMALFNYRNSAQLSQQVAERERVAAERERAIRTNRNTDPLGRLLNEPAVQPALAPLPSPENPWTGVVIAVLLATVSALLLARIWDRRERGLERVTVGVEAFAKGNLDHRIDLSSPDLRPLAENLGVMTKQLRDQIAREAETRQFQSFVRLSAILTHDLKNAIEALSLTVSNMERHFDDPDFRVDAMKSLTGATDKLRALVTRLSEPVITLSGEHKLPQPVDLVPTLRRVISMTAEAASNKHQVAVDLPESLYALVDGERIEKVAENLIINALEAMEKKPGTVSVLAGTTQEGKPFFSVSDTGEGMSERFIEEKLFRPFATTKRRGVGLGLYTCREVVVANGGSIVVDSKEGVGTAFRVVLPSAAAAKSSESSAANSSQS